MPCDEVRALRFPSPSAISTAAMVLIDTLTLAANALRQRGGYVEIKASATVNPQDFKGLAKLADYAGSHFAQGVLFYTGSEILPFKQEDLVFHAIPLSVLLP